MQADKLEGGWGEHSSIGNGHGDRGYSRSSHEDPDRRRSSRRHDDDRGYDDRRSSRRHDDMDDDRRRRDRDRDPYRRDRERDSDRYRDGHRDRDRDHRSDRDRGDRGDRDRRDRRDNDRRGRGDDRDGGKATNSGGAEVFGAGNAARSPTPEGTIPISKRKRTKTAWDIKAPGFEEFTSLQAKMTGVFNLPGQTRPMSGFTSQGAPGNSGGGLPEIHLGSAGDLSSMNSGANYARQARRLYVGNITMQANERNVGEFFNHQMRVNQWAVDNDPAGVQGPDPVVSVQVNHEKSYAFVEFRSAEESSRAMGFDGIVFQDQVLKIRRPKDYVGDGQTSGPAHIPGVVSTNVPDTPNKIFIGGLPSYLNDVQVMELLQSFGELRSFNLVKEGNTNNSKGFAFCEYVDPSVTDIACQGLNGMELGDRYLVVQRAAIGANPSKQAYNQGRDGGNPHGNNGDASQMLGRIAPDIVAAATAGDSNPTRVLQMLNMVTPDELTDDTEFEEIVEDIKEECGKYGTVLDVKVPRPILNENGKMDKKASEALPDLGKVFVMYEKVEHTKAAMMSIAGRQFGGRSIICAYADEEKMV